MRREDDQQLWDLLGRAAQPPHLSDFFARNILRRLREAPQPFARLQTWLTARRLIPATAVVLILFGAAVLVEHPFSRGINSGGGAQEIVAQIDPQDFEVVADLDVLIASDENSLWDDDQTL